MDAIIKLAESMKGMTASEIVRDAVLLLVGLSAFIEITPIKINPVSAIFRWIGDKINAPLIERIDAIAQTQNVQQQKLVELQDSMDDNEIDRIRWEILDFANSCRNGRMHTQDEFIHIISLNTKYHDILAKRDLTNGLIDLEYSYIEKLYQKCSEKNSFL